MANEAAQYTPSAWQAGVHRSRAKQKCIWAGRRAGKGRSVLYEVLALIEEASLTPVMLPHRPNERLTAREAGLVPPIHVWVVAPTYPQGQQVWNEMKEFIPDHLVRKVTRGGGRGTGWNNDRMNVWLDMKDERGQWLPGRPRPSCFWEIKSADNQEALQTVGLDGLWVTEAQDVAEAAWKKVSPTLYSPGRFGRSWLEGIPPMSRAHWFSKRYRYAAAHRSERAEAFHATYRDNPFLTKEQIKQIEEELLVDRTEAEWERMYLAKQPASGGGWFVGIEEAMRGEELTGPQPHRWYVAGLDLGKKQDETVLIVKDRQSRHSVSVTALSGIDWNVQEETIVHEALRWNLSEIRMDSTGLGDPMYDRLLDRGLPVIPFNFTTMTKYQLFNAYAIALARRTVSFPVDWIKLQGQLEAIEVRKAGLGYSFSTIDNSHDDWVDAELLALMACEPETAMGEDEYKPVAAVGAAPALRPNGRRARSPIMARIKRRRSEARLEEWKRDYPELWLNGQFVEIA